MKIILLLIAVLLAFSSIAQKRIPLPSDIKNISLKKPVPVSKEYTNPQSQAVPVPFLLPSKSLIINYEEIGSTLYDLQTNASVDHRMYLWPDGTIGTTWTKGDLTSYADCGTGYQYFNGTAWIDPLPTGRIESVNAGWPSYSHLGLSNEGEVIIAHTGTQLIMNKRAAKGTGAWIESLIPASGGADPTWPRICTKGNNIHVLSSSNNAWGGQTFPIWYSRSTDAGASWDIQNVIPAGLTPADGYVQGFGGDLYSWAEPNNNKLAFVIGGNWTDLILMKSNDNGTTWSKTVIFQHPYPNFNEAHDLIGDSIVNTDTPYVCDGSLAVALDQNGIAHVTFGIMRVMNSDTTDAATDYFPATDGLAFWREGDPPFTQLNPDSVYASGHLIAWVQDRDGDGVVFENWQTTNTFAQYFTSLTSMSQLVLGDAGEVYVIYTSTCEDAVNAGGEYFNHVWETRSLDHGYTNTWGDNIELTCDFDLMECVFPATSQTSDDRIHFACQIDNEPGLSVRGDLDPAATNSIIYFNLTKSDFTKTTYCGYIKVNSVNLSNSLNIYPNPITKDMNISFNLNKSTHVNMTVVNIVGSTVMSQQFVAENGGTKKIDVSKLSTGIYLARFETANGIFTQKIVKQ